MLLPIGGTRENGSHKGSGMAAVNELMPNALSSTGGHHVRPVASPERGPIGGFTRELLIEYTKEWEGERFPDGRPKVADDVIERMRNVTLTQAWGTCRGAEYNFQFEGGFMNPPPGNILCGRAVTATFMPRRPDCRRALDEQGEKGGHEGDHITGRSTCWSRVTSTSPTSSARLTRGRSSATISRL